MEEYYKGDTTLEPSALQDSGGIGGQDHIPANDVVDTDDLIKDVKNWNVEEFKDKEEENDNLRSKMQIL